MNSIWPIIGTVGLGIVVGILVADFKHVIARLCGWMLRRASASLPHSLRARFREEWAGNLDAVKDAPLSALALTAHTLLRTRPWIRAVDGAYLLATDIARPRDPVQSLSARLSEVLLSADQLQIRLSRRSVEHAASLVAMGVDGHITVDSDPFSAVERFATTLVETAEPGDELWASSMVSPRFWTQSPAYLRQQNELITRRGVAIRRVFVFDAVGSYGSPEAQALLRRQRESGVDVYSLVAPREMTSRDLLVIRKPVAAGAQHGARSFVDWQEAYAMECRVGSDRQVDRIDIWSANEIQSEYVRRAWWTLRAMFDEAERWS